VPALPLEARTIREDNGKGGLPSLLALTGHLHRRRPSTWRELGRVHTWWKGETVTTVATDETIVVSLCAGVMLAFISR
jgi:hypothetical protein